MFKTLVSKRTIIIASTSIIIAVITIVSVNVMGSGGPVTGFANIVSRPIRALAATVAHTFENIYASIYRYDNLMADYERALMTITEYERTYRESAEIAEENALLRAAMMFGERHAGYQSEQMILANWSADNWSSSFTVNRGYMNSAIKNGDGVATEYGVLIGQVKEVSAATSIIVTVLDTTFSASAFVGDSGATATIKGDFTHMRNGLLMLDHIDDDLIVLPGDLVVTSGHGGVFPSGLVVGEVIEVLRHNTGIGRYATVKPMREIDTITYVFVITDFVVPEE